MKTFKFEKIRIGTRPALNKLSLTVDPGSVVAFVGKSGCGKSSLFAAILRLVDYSGRIEMNGIELREIQKSILRKLIAIVPQKCTILTSN